MHGTGGRTPRTDTEARRALQRAIDAHDHGGDAFLHDGEALVHGDPGDAVVSLPGPGETPAGAARRS